MYAAVFLARADGNATVQRSQQASKHACDHPVQSADSCSLAFWQMDYLVEVEDEIKLADVAEVVIQDFHKQMDGL